MFLVSSYVLLRPLPLLLVGVFLGGEIQVQVWVWKVESGPLQVGRVLVNVVWASHSGLLSLGHPVLILLVSMFEAGLSGDGG